VKAGLELTQSLSGQHFTNVGPVVTWKAAASVNLVLTGLIALNHRDENFDEIRLILEWEF
jgi:hypothetical protein